MSSKYPYSVREPLFAYEAAKQTVSLTINSDLMARVKALGINASRIAEDALARELERKRREILEEEIRIDVAVAEAYVAKYGSFAEMMRQHYAGQDSAKDDDAV